MMEAVSRKVESSRFSFLDDSNAIASTVRDDGSVVFYIEGMVCAECIWQLEKLPQLHENISKVQVFFGSSSVKIWLINVRPPVLSEVAATIHSLGYFPRIVQNNEDVESYQLNERRKQLLRIGVAAALAGQIMIMAVSVYAGAEAEFERLFSYLSFCLALPAVTYCAWPFYRSSWAQLRHASITIDLPIALAIVMGFSFSSLQLFRGLADVYFDSLVVLIFLLLSARFLLDQAQKGIAKQSYLRKFYQPHKVERLTDGANSEWVDADNLRAGDLIALPAGEVCPVDGVVYQGTSHVNNAVITGESSPVRVSQHRSIYAGAKNITSRLVILVKSAGRDTRLGKIIDSVTENVLKKSRKITFTDQLAKGFTVLIVLGGLGTFFYHLSAGWAVGFARALSVVVIACPCALALATPLSLSLALGRLARRGILLKDISVLEKLPKATDYFFDKTGTLTRGDYSVLAFSALTERDRATILAIEQKFYHPVAIALQEYLSEEMFTILPAVDSFQKLSTGGISASVAGEEWQILPVASIPGEADLPALASSHLNTKVTFLKNGNVRGYAVLGDKLHIAAKPLLAKLKNQGTKRFLLSGDQDAPVEYLAETLKLDGHQARMTPEQKAEAVALVNRNKAATTVMIGDGANDAIALAKANIGIAMHGNLDASLQACDVYLTEGSLEKVEELLRFTGSVNLTIWRNLFFSATYNIVGVGLAFAGYISPLVAAVLMPLSSAIVILSSLYGVRR